MDHASLLKKLALTLRQRLQVIADSDLRHRNPEEHLEQLKEASGAIEEAIGALSKTVIDPRLRHYLERHSYDKALCWLEEELSR